MANAADFVRLALALPDVVEYPHFDRRAFKARITFATLAPDGASANLKFLPDEQEFKCLLAPEAFAPIANAWGARAGPSRRSRRSAKMNCEPRWRWPSRTRERKSENDAVQSRMPDEGDAGHVASQRGAARDQVPFDF